MSRKGVDPACDILAVCYGGGHVNMIVPVIKQLRRRYPEIKVAILGLTNAQPVLREAGLDFFTCRDFLDANDTPAIQYGTRLVEGMDTSMLGEQESIAYLGLSYRDLVARLGEDGARKAYEKIGRQAFLPVAFLGDVIHRLNPKLVLATSAPRAERAAIIAAGANDIPAVCLVDLFAMAEVEWLKDNDFADRICVISQGVADRLTAHGRNADDICVIGNPAFDRLAKPSLSNLGLELRDRRGWGQDDYVILFASQPEPATDAQTGEAGDINLPSRVEAFLARLGKRRQDLKIIVRRHPNQLPVDDAEADSGLQYSPIDEELSALLSAVDCVVTFSSTVGIEAALLGKQLIVLEISLTSKNAPYAEMGLAAGVGELDELEGAIDRAKAERASVPEGLLRPGGAADRVCDEIISLLN